MRRPHVDCTSGGHHQSDRRRSLSETDCYRSGSGQPPRLSEWRILCRAIVVNDRPTRKPHDPKAGHPAGCARRVRVDQKDFRRVPIRLWRTFLTCRLHSNVLMGGTVKNFANRTSASVLATALSGMALSVPVTAFAAGEQPQASENEGGLGIITVTARKREESLLETPIAISALTAQDIEKRGIT